MSLPKAAAMEINRHGQRTRYASRSRDIQIQTVLRHLCDVDKCQRRRQPAHGLRAGRAALGGIDLLTWSGYVWTRWLESTGAAGVLSVGNAQEHVDVLIYDTSILNGIRVFDDKTASRHSRSRSQDEENCKLHFEAEPIFSVVECEWESAHLVEFILANCACWLSFTAKGHPCLQEITCVVYSPRGRWCKHPGGLN